ncbi:hypothetical protein L9H26_04380 [Morganella psychrotolerans]|uniref:Uncharacterized protein n=1 Tax=Morganella psychrotolerans TaxID=368603 RepID=A0A5M9RA19_9GAMM|nr:hypothetical protein [Morganella psychrotolerans]KAA8717393.1 hypothetical protein F4V73_05960 [Morganella psychrotolerans]OBU08331.1 hypothetical protein AYY16_03070 [Morganella psychrotolerans]
MENYVYLTGLVMTISLSIYILLSRKIPSGRKMVYGFVLFTFILGFSDTYSERQAFTEQNVSSPDSREGVSLADR